MAESSGLLSLAALREHEKRSVEQQAGAARARAEAEQRARQAAERASLHAQQERQQAERLAAERAEHEQRAARERSAVQQEAERERARDLERAQHTLQRTLDSEREARRAKELALIAQLLRQRTLTWVAGALCLGSWLALAAAYFAVLQPRAERTRSTADQSLQAERSARAQAEAMHASSARERNELSLRVASLEQRLRDAQNTAPAALPARGGARGPTRTPAAPRAVPCRDDGDPLNPCLAH